MNGELGEDQGQPGPGGQREDRANLDHRKTATGFLLGAELGTIRSRLDRTAEIILCAGEQLSAVYALALRSLRLFSRTRVIPPADAARLAVQGHRLLLRRLGND